MIGTVHALGMMLQATGFALELLLILTLIGFGVATVALRGSTGLNLYLAPLIGLAILAVAIQLLTPFLPSWVTLVSVLIGFGGFSLWTAWRRRAQLRAPIRTAGIDLAIVAAIALALYHALLAYVYVAGRFTLAGWPSDNMEFYAPAGHYLRAHAFNLTHPLQLVDNPTTHYLARAASEFPNSVGSIDGALSVLTRWQVIQLFDPLNALLSSLILPAAYVLLRQLGASRPARIAGVLLLAANQFVFWVMGLGFQQEMQAMPLFTAALALLILALQDLNPLAGLLAGFTAGSILGLYLPLFVLFVICAAGYVAVVAVGAALRRTPIPAGTQVLRIAAGGLIGSAAALYWLFQGEGIQFWSTVSTIKYAAGGIATVPSIKVLLGIAPLSAVIWPSVPTLWWGPGWDAISGVLAVLVVILMAGGVLEIAFKRNLPLLGLLATAGLYLFYLRFIERYPYGFVKTVTFLVPLTSALIAIGAVDLITTLHSRRTLEAELRPRRPAPAWRPASILLTATLIPVFIAQALASIDMQRLWAKTGPTFPASFSVLAALPDYIPNRAHVLVVNPSTTYADEIKFSAVRYYLIETNLDVEKQILPSTQAPHAYQYLVAPNAVDPGAGFRLLWTDPGVALALYKAEPGA